MSLYYVYHKTVVALSLVFSIFTQATDKEEGLEYAKIICEIICNFRAYMYAKIICKIICEFWAYMYAKIMCKIMCMQATDKEEGLEYAKIMCEITCNFKIMCKIICMQATDKEEGLEPGQFLAKVGPWAGTSFFTTSKKKLMDLFLMKQFFLMALSPGNFYFLPRLAPGLAQN